MAKKSGFIENNPEETTEVTPVSSPIVETPKVETQISGHQSRDFYSPING